MRELSHYLDWQALFLGFLAGYCVPVLLACVMHPALWHLWFWVLAPAAAGYVAAKVASNLPLLHGLAVSVLGLLVFGLVSSPKPLSTWVVWIAISVTCSLFGAWLWRRSSRETA